MRIVGLICLLICFCPSAYSQNTRPQVSEAPWQAMQRLKPLLGQWQMTMYITEDDGKTWQESPPKMVDVAFDMKELMITKQPRGESKQGFAIKTYISYDQYRQRYRLAVMDDTWGVMDIYEGLIEDNKLVVTNMKAGTFFPIDDKTWRGFKLVLDLTQDKRQMRIHKTDDNGASWQPAFKLDYLAVASAKLTSANASVK